MEEELLGKSQSVYHGDRYVGFVEEGVLVRILTYVPLGSYGLHLLLHQRIRRNKLRCRMGEWEVVCCTYPGVCFFFGEACLNVTRFSFFG